MPSFSDFDLVRVGVLQKPHGIAGTMLLLFDAGWGESIQNTKFLFIKTDGLPVPWKIREDGIHITSSESALVDLIHIDDEKSAKKLCGKDVFLEKSVASNRPEEELLCEWSGYTIRERNGKTYGKIIESNNYSGNQVLSVETPGGICLVPYHPDLVNHIDQDLKIIIMDLPSGL